MFTHFWHSCKLKARRKTASFAARGRRLSGFRASGAGKKVLIVFFVHETKHFLAVTGDRWRRRQRSLVRHQRTNCID